jgi:MFS family permease
MCRLPLAFLPTHVSSSGNIIANAGFVRQVGFPDAKGVYKLNPSHTALWGALQSLGQLIAMLFLTPISDRIGRKMTLYALWIILLGVSWPS